MVRSQVTESAMTENGLKISDKIRQLYKSKTIVKANELDFHVFGTWSVTSSHTVHREKYDVCRPFYQNEKVFVENIV